MPEFHKCISALGMLLGSLLAVPTLKTDAVRSSETALNICQTVRRHSPDNNTLEILLYETPFKYLSPDVFLFLVSKFQNF
jgi:hypothetical protein